MLKAALCGQASIDDPLTWSCAFFGGVIGMVIALAIKGMVGA